MKVQKLLLAAAVWAAIVTVPVISFAQHHDLTHDQPAQEDAVVEFGVAPTGPLGPPPCIQSGTGIGGPTDPCAYKNHHLTPVEVTILKGGQVEFDVHGGGHSVAIYKVSNDTTRDELGQFLCAGMDPATIADPADHVCNLLTSNSDASHSIADGEGDVVIVAATNPPDGQVLYAPGRLMSANAVADGRFVTYRFLKTGRYLVICMSRTHFLNNWMFGFVNVVGGDEEEE
jgi:hypothetical protein